MILLLGGSGYVGGAYHSFLESNGCETVSLSRAEVDYGDTPTLLRFLREHKPEFLVNCAGYTGKPNVDACESDKTNCLFGNGVLPGRIAEACAEAGVPWGHVSSGCIYTGAKADGSGFTEEDPPNFSFRQDNCSYYSGTKALGEEILDGCDNVYIWRLRIPFNHLDSPRNYISKLMRYDKVLDATNSISHLDEFVASCHACWEKKVPFGIYNLTNPGEITARQVIDQIKKHGLSDKDFQFFDDERDFMQKAAIAPRSNCVLDSRKLAGVGIHMTPVLEALDRSMANWVTEKS
ncbi:MAG: sugar nucleotide-binding protein [Kiritimatiellia bacterium]